MTIGAVRSAPATAPPGRFRSSEPRFGEAAGALLQRMIALAEVASEVITRGCAEASDLSCDEWRIISVLEGRGQLRTAQVIERSGIHKIRICRALWRLERCGHVLREYDPVDRRVQLVTLSEGGEALLRSIAASIRSREADFFGALSPRERSLLGQLVEKIQSGAAASPPAARSRRARRFDSV